MGLGVNVEVDVGGGEVNVGVKVISGEVEQAEIKRRSEVNIKRNFA
jgi:hypothetical protein